MGGLGTISNGIASYITREHASRMFIPEYNSLNAFQRLPINDYIGVVLTYDVGRWVYILRLYKLSDCGGLTIVRDGNLVVFKYVAIPTWSSGSFTQVKVGPRSAVNPCAASSIGLLLDRDRFNRLMIDSDSYLHEGGLTNTDDTFQLRYIANGVGVFVGDTLIFAITDKLTLNADATILASS